MKMLSILLLAGLYGVYSSLTYVPTKQVTVSYTVSTGETMYEIGKKLAEEYGDTRDIREINYQAKKASGKIEKNGKVHSEIYAGEKLTYVLEVKEY